MTAPNTSFDQLSHQLDSELSAALAELDKYLTQLDSEIAALRAAGRDTSFYQTIADAMHTSRAKIAREIDEISRD